MQAEIVGRLAEAKPTERCFGVSRQSGSNDPLYKGNLAVILFYFEECMVVHSIFLVFMVLEDRVMR